MRVATDIHEEQVDIDGRLIDGIRVTCARCDHYVDVPGIGGGSARYAGKLLNDECPRGESNL